MKTTNEQRQFQIDRLHHAIADARNHPTAYPILARHGFMETTPNGYRAIDAETVISRSRELIRKLESEIE